MNSRTCFQYTQLNAQGHEKQHTESYNSQKSVQNKLEAPKLFSYTVACQPKQQTWYSSLVSYPQKHLCFVVAKFLPQMPLFPAVGKARDTTITAAAILEHDSNWHPVPVFPACSYCSGIPRRWQNHLSRAFPHPSRTFLKHSHLNYLIYWTITEWIKNS